MNTFHTQMLSICLLKVLCRPWYSVGMQIGTIGFLALAHVIRLVGWLKRVKSPLWRVSGCTVCDRTTP